MITFILLFQPWITASGPNGKAEANAFGRIIASTRYLTIWSSSKMALANITGFWALLATAAIIVAVLTVAVNLRVRNETLARVATVSSVAVAILVFCTLLYINSKGAELKAMTSRRWDMGGQIGSLMSWFLGDDKLTVPGISETRYSTTSLTPAAIIAGITSLGSAVAAVTQWICGHRTKPVLLWRFFAATPRSSSDVDSTD